MVVTEGGAGYSKDKGTRKPQAAFCQSPCSSASRFGVPRVAGTKYQAVDRVHRERARACPPDCVTRAQLTLSVIRRCMTVLPRWSYLLLALLLIVIGSRMPLCARVTREVKARSDHFMVWALRTTSEFERKAA